MPLDLARLDIYFLHHILEVCYYFLNLSDPAHNVFDLIYYILFKNTISVPYSRAQKRVLICRFFMLLDMYREQEYLHNNWVQALLSVPIESILKQDLHPIQHSVDALLMHCFTMHPQKKQFKTSW